MEKSKKRVICAIVAVCVVLVLVFVSIMTNTSNSYNFKNNAYIFETIEDLDFLNDHIVDDNIKDKNLGNLNYSASKCMRIKFDGNNYKLFAYEFNSVEDSFIYGEVVSGNDYQRAYKDTGIISHYYHAHYSFIFVQLSCKVLVLNGTNSLYIEAKGIDHKQLNKFFDYLFSHLPQKVETLF